MRTLLDEAHDLAAFLAAVDGLDADLVISHLTRNARLCIGGAPAASGRKAIRSMIIQLFSQLDTLRHEPVAVWRTEGIAVLDADVRYSYTDGGAGMLPVTHILRLEGALISDIRVFTCMDLAAPVRGRQEVPGGGASRTS